MKYLELRRHALRHATQDVLTKAGQEQAERVGETLPGHYDGLFVSSARRAAETAAYFMRALGQKLPQNHAIFEPFQNPGSEGELQETVREMFRLLPPGGRGLAVGHTPLIETAVRGLTGEKVRPLKECEGLTVVEDDGDYRLEAEHRLED
jgi:phosphohistidine phosphatase SixA